MGEIIERRTTWIITAITALGLALRVAAAQGGLWLDEAWSAVMAQQAGSPLGVFLNINHDNNHHLNSLWLELVGLDTRPLLQRAFSIFTGTAAIPVVALLARRRSAFAAMIAALLFALSPILVTYGSEARGYAPMLLAFLTMALLIDRWLDRADTAPPAVALAILTLLGLLAQLTMIFGLAALGVWTAIVVHRRDAALLPTLARLWLVPAIAAALSLALIFVPAWLHGGMAFGSVEPFTLPSWIAGFGQALDYTFGDALALIGAFAVMVLVTDRPTKRLVLLATAAILVTPLAVLLVQPPNAGGGRLYLVASAGALLLITAQIDHALALGQRRLATIVLALVVITMAVFTGRTIADHRADPAQALAAIAARAPAGGDAAVERPRSDAILIAAAASARYPLQIRQACPAARFLFIERDGTEPFPAAPTHCNAAYREIAGDTVQTLSGTQWKLYERSAR